MPFDLPHVAARVFGTPLLLHRDKLDTILSAVGPRLLAGLEIDTSPEAAGLRDGRRERGASMGGRRYFSGGGYMADDGIAVLPIYGTLIRRGTWLDSASGLTSYGALTEAVTEIMFSPDVRGLMCEYDTPGGEAGGVFDLSRFMRRISEATGKPIWAHANELAASAGYALASSCEAGGLWVSTTGEVGSIGVVAAHIDVSGADTKAGVRWTYIFEGDEKVDGNAHEPLSDRAASTIQADVADLYGMFVDLVAQNRAIPVEEIRATNARVYRGSIAVDAGLADELGTFDDAMSAFAERLDEMQTSGGSVASASSMRRSMMADRSAKPKPGASVEEKPEGATESTTSTSPGSKDDEGQGSQDDEGGKGKGKGKEEEGESDAAKASAAERKRCAELHGIGSQASRMGVKFDVGAAIEKGTTAAAAREAVMSAAADRDEAQAQTSHSAGKPGDAAKKTTEAAHKAAWGKALKRR